MRSLETVVASFFLMFAVTTIHGQSPVLLSISVSPAIQNVGAGDQVAFVASGQYSSGPSPLTFAGGIAWSTGDQTIATVDPMTGVVTGLKVGASTQVIAKEATSGFSAAALITVGPPTAVLHGFTVQPASPTVAPGGTLQMEVLGEFQRPNGPIFTAPIMPYNAAVTWVSSLGANAAIDPKSGKVSGIKAGTANITATVIPVAPAAALTTPTMTTVVTVASPALAGLVTNDPDICKDTWNDCDWHVTTVGGVEQADLSSQDSQTEPFIDFFATGNRNSQFGSLWSRIRFLGAPSSSNTQNIVSAATDPTGTVTSSSLSTVGVAIDYVVGVEHDWLRPSMKHTGQITVGFIGAFGATTPLSASNATSGYAVPAYGTNECTQLIARFQTKPTGAPGSYGGYNPPLPNSATIITTTVVGNGAPTMTTSPEYCSVQPSQTSTTSTTGGVTTTVTTTGTQITNVAFSPQDRSSFLLKDIAGARFIFRQHPDATDLTATSRDIIDFTVGQDQAISGGYLRHLVFKSDAIFRIPASGVYVFASSSIRITKNRNLPPLILTPTPVSTGSGSSTSPGVTIPSPSVFVLPLKQSDRDFYRIGIAIDLSGIFNKLFAKTS